MSPSMKRVIAALQMGARKPGDLALAAHVCEKHARDCLSKLRDQIHIGRWERNRVGPPIPVYAWGPGTDARRPEPMPSAEKCRRYRASQREKFGEHYGLVHAAQKKSIPGRRVVVAGKVIYEQTLR